MLEPGDHIAYFIKNGYKLQNNAGKIHVFMIIKHCDKNTFEKYKHKVSLFICETSDVNDRVVIQDKNIYNIFPENKLILTTPNLRIHRIFSFSELDNLEKFKKEIHGTEPPILIVENVISEELKEEIINIFHSSENKNIENKITKNRTHVFADRQLTEKLDYKLSKSLFPELKKIYDLDITYRENYKICGYKDIHNGKFHVHRDSVHPYGHRRLAMSLILNEDYEGGGIIFPEYNNKAYKPKSCSAVIFPTPLFHQVLQVTKGTRYVIVSFFFGEEEADYKRNFNKNQNKNTNIDNYKINVKENFENLILENIFPKN